MTLRAAAQLSSLSDSLRMRSIIFAGCWRAGPQDASVYGHKKNTNVFQTDTLGALDALKPDLLFLDVQMPEMNGFAVLRARGADRMPAVVFVTAHDQFAVRAFEAHAIDYLVKPLNVERFDAALERVANACA